jgi:hypothetical protein
MTRRGKIARLPRNIRETLNSRLENGDPGDILVLWLNTLPEVRSILAAYFHGRPISEQNLSEWKLGGFIDWQRKQDTCARVRGLLDFTLDLDNASAGQSLPDRLADLLAAELAANAQQILEQQPDSPQRQRQISDILAQLHKIRTGKHAAERLRIQTERWQFQRKQQERAERDTLIAEAKDQATAPLFEALKRPAMVTAFGGGEAAGQIVDNLLDINQKARDLKRDWDGLTHAPSDSTPPPDQTPNQPVQTQSDLTTPNQG